MPLSPDQHTIHQEHLDRLKCSRTIIIFAVIGIAVAIFLSISQDSYDRPISDETRRWYQEINNRQYEDLLLAIRDARTPQRKADAHERLEAFLQKLR